MNKPPSAFSTIYWAFSAVLIAAGVARVWNMRWLHDDAFVTFRYVDNFWNGLGLVWNAGERVEGFTHPLWMGLLLAARALGGSPVQWSLVFGAASVAGTLACAAYLSWRLADRRPTAFPFALLALILHFDFVVWGTSGLETAFLGFLIIAAFTVYFFTPLPPAFKIPLLGLLLTAAAATRPDAVIWYAMAMALLAVRGIVLRQPMRQLIRDLALFNLPAILLMLPWLIWKIQYYGGLLPNTYYVKSGGGQQWGYGLFYLWMFFRFYVMESLFFIGIPVAALLWIKRRRAAGQSPDPHLVPISVALAGLALYTTLFIVRVGGDYMFARMLMPLLPFMYLTIEWMIRRGLATRPAAATAVFVLLPFVILGENHLRRLKIEPPENNIESFWAKLDENFPISDEHWFYTARYYTAGRNNIEMQEQLGLRLGEGLAAQKDVVVLMVASNATAYYSRIPTVIEYYGLTDAVIAHEPPDLSQRPGHQKRPTLEYLRERGVDFYVKDIDDYTPAHYQKSFFQFELLYPLTIFTYDAALINEIAERNKDRFLYTNFPQWLDQYIQSTMPTLQRDQVAADLEKFRRYYFAFNADATRENQITNWLSENESSAIQP